MPSRLIDEKQDGMCVPARHPWRFHPDATASPGYCTWAGSGRPPCPLSDRSRRRYRSRRLRWSLGAEGRVPRLAQRRGDLVLLADARLVGKPDFNRARIDVLFPRDFVRARGKLFKILDCVRSLRMMPGPRRGACDSPWPAIPGSLSRVETTTWNASNICWQRSTSRQRTTP